MINKFFEGDFYQKTEKQKSMWENFMWRLYHAELVRNFSDRAEVKDALSALTDDMIEMFCNDKKFEKFMFRKLVDKSFEELECRVKNREEQEFRLPAIDTMLMKAYVLHLYKKELGFKDIYEVPTKEFVKERCKNKCELFKLNIGEKSCCEIKYIDRLFGYKKSIRDISNEWGWLSLYQKFISGLKAYTDNVIVKKEKFTKNNKIIVIYGV